MTLRLAALLAASCLTLVATGADAPTRRVVIVTMDGLRPDSVTEADMPNLFRLARDGTFFAAHHPVYISSTEVNGAALATGMTPAHSGITGNIEYRPEVDPARLVDTQDEWAIWKGDEVSGGKWLLAKTLPEIVRMNGGKTAVAGTKGVAILWDRLHENRSPESPTVYAGQAIPTSIRDELVMRQGPLPPSSYSAYFPNRAQDAWTTQAAISRLWAGGVPALTVIWLSEPDYAQHATGPGSKVAREALKSSDECLGRILAALDAARVRDQTDIFVVSDHGFSTVAQGVDVISDLRAKGFNAASAFLEEPDPGTIVVVPLGGSISYSVVGDDQAQIDRLVHHLQGTGYAGVVFTKNGVDGTFKFSEAGIDSPKVADVIMAMRWSGETFRREGAMPGLTLSTSYDAGQGMHGSLSRYDMRNTLIAAGPDFKRGLRSTIPSGNSDVAPTVLKVLGITPPAPMDGRVLEEALVNSTAAPAVETQTLQASRRVDPTKMWQQYLKVSTVAGRRYYDEGNAGAPPPP